jgi:hypothetical protein
VGLSCLGTPSGCERFSCVRDLGYALAAICFVHDAGVVPDSYLWFSLAARGLVLGMTELPKSAE